MRARAEDTAMRLTTTSAESHSAYGRSPCDDGVKSARVRRAKAIGLSIQTHALSSRVPLSALGCCDSHATADSAWHTVCPTCRSGTGQQHVSIVGSPGILVNQCSHRRKGPEDRGLFAEKRRGVPRCFHYHAPSTFENYQSRLIHASAFAVSGGLHNFLALIARRHRTGSPTTPVVGPG